jgi:hypothetical protein
MVAIFVVQTRNSTAKQTKMSDKIKNKTISLHPSSTGKAAWRAFPLQSHNSL